MPKKLLSICLMLPLFISAQTVQTKLKIFIDCAGTGCDEAYLKSEIKIVDFVRENSDADVHVLISSRSTDGGAERYHLIFFGQGRFNNLKDTLSFASKRDDTPVEKRAQLTHYIKSGLVPFISRTTYASGFVIDMKKDTATKAPIIQVGDPEWNYFVFSIGAEGEYSADQNYTSARGSGNLIVNRTTEKSRFALGGFRSKYSSVYKYEDSIGITEYKVENSDFGIYQFTVFSVGEHLSMGYEVRYSGSTFSNIKTKFYFHPLIEINFFKYRDIYNKSFLLRYGFDYSDFQFYDTTIYNKKRQFFYGHEASMVMNLYQKWGTFTMGGYFRSYLYNPKLNSVGAHISFNIRLISGLSFYASGAGNIIHDQIYLPKGNSSERDLLLRRRQLASTFDYYTSAGLFLRFGSKVNNAVNPRMTGFRGF